MLRSLKNFDLQTSSENTTQTNAQSSTKTSLSMAKKPSRIEFVKRDPIFDRNFKGRLNRTYHAFKASNVRKLPIVGDVHLSREEWPATAEDWQNLWKLKKMPALLSKIVYAIDEKNQAFKAIRLVFDSQTFQSFDLAATACTKRQVAHVSSRKPIRSIRIKQKNNVDGVS